MRLGVRHTSAEGHGQQGVLLAASLLAAIDHDAVLRPVQILKSQSGHYTTAKSVD